MRNAWLRQREASASRVPQAAARLEALASATLQAAVAREEENKASGVSVFFVWWCTRGRQSVGLPFPLCAHTRLPPPLPSPSPSTRRCPRPRTWRQPCPATRRARRSRLSSACPPGPPPCGRGCPSCCRASRPASSRCTQATPTPSEATAAGGCPGTVGLACMGWWQTLPADI